MYKFTNRELTELIISFIVISFCFAISNVGMDVYGIFSILPIVMIGVAAGFISHETGHKFVAMKYGYTAEFKLLPIGLLIAFLTSLIGFVFAIAGAINIHEDERSDEINGKISIAGPMTNIALAVIFIVIAAFTYPLSLTSGIFKLIYLICAVGYSVNSYLAAFNLLPIATLDGTKVLKWNIRIWIFAFVIAGSMTLLSMTIGAENMVKMLIDM